MRDFSAILRKASQEASKIGGNTGYSGNGRNSSNTINDVDPSSAVSTSELALATVATYLAKKSDSVATVASGLSAVDTLGDAELDEQHQRVAENVSTVASVSTKNNEVLNKADPAAIRRAALRNSIDLFELQTDTMHCFVCHEREDPERPFIPVCTASPGRNHWIHLSCHGAHVSRVNARVEAAAADLPPF